MKKCLFFLPYFGKFPEYFELFLRSCEINNAYNWIIFTDNNEKYNYPTNVKVIYLSFQEFRTKIKIKVISYAILNQRMGMFFQNTQKVMNIGGIAIVI